MAEMPLPTVYHRWLGWHARALRRILVTACLGLTVTALLWLVAGWEVAAVSGWNAMAVSFLLSTWPMILRANGPATRKLASVEDETRGSSFILLLAASIVSLVGVIAVLHSAGGAGELRKLLLVAIGALTVVISWTTVNTVFVLRYADEYYRLPAGAIDFGTGTGQAPDYRDFAYFAFTIGMTYQVSDTTVRRRRIRRTVLWHALLSYMFGVVIVSGAVSLIAGLVS
jgi:uncharacterized membrane protein